MQKYCIYLLIIFVGFILFSACGKDNPSSPEPDPSENPNAVSKDIGPEGGDITSKDGKLTLEIPAGALGNMQTITIEEIDPEDLNSKFDSINVEDSWELGPDGLEFDQPITATIHSDQNVFFEDSVSVQPQAVYSLDQDQVFPLDNILVEADLVNETVQVKALLSHFSPLVLEAVLQTPANGERPREFFRVENVPEERNVGDPWIISWTIIDILSQGSLSDLPDFSGSLIDQSSSPVALTDPSISDMIPVNSRFPSFSEFQEHFGPVEYTCTEPGSGTFSMTSVWYNQSFFLLEFEQRISVKQEITCLPVEKKTLTVNFTGNGTGNVTSSPEGIDCESSEEECSHDFDKDTSVELTATPTGDSRFCGWDTGVDTEAKPVVIVELDRDGTITACFEKQESQTADMSINLIGPDNPVEPDEKSNLEVTVNNYGPDDVPAEETSIMLEFSEGVNYDLPEDDNITCEASDNQLTCVPEGDDPFSAESEINFVTQFTCQSSSDTCTISAEVQTSSVDDPNQENNTDQIEITVEEENNSVNPEDIEGDWTYTLSVEESSCYAEDLTPDAEISLVDEDNGTLEIAFDLILDPKVTGNVEQDGTFSGETPWIHTQDDLDYKFILEGTFTENDQDFTFDGIMLNEIRDSETKESICSRTYNAEGEKTGE